MFARSRDVANVSLAACEAAPKRANMPATLCRLTVDAAAVLMPAIGWAVALAGREACVSVSSLLLFAAVYFAAVATPGPGVAALVARVLGHGLVGVAPFILGYVVGDLIWLAIAATGLAAIAHLFAGAFVALRLAGAAYLIVIAWGMARSSFADAEEAAAPPKATRGWRAFSGSLSLTLGNPKVIVFFLSIMPLVVDLNALTPTYFRRRRGDRGRRVVSAHARRLCARRRPRAPGFCFVPRAMRYVPPRRRPA